MKRRCLGCGAFIGSGSRCKSCQRGYRDDSGGHAKAKRVKQRDGYACRECGRADRPVKAHHIIPLSEGGLDLESNMITLCDLCHDARHGRKSHNG